MRCDRFQYPTNNKAALDYYSVSKREPEKRPKRSLARRAVPYLLAAGAGFLALRFAGSSLGKYPQTPDRLSIDDALFYEEGDVSGSVQQKDVDAEYARLYTQISDAKQKADANGKKLAIVLGEMHTASLAYLHEMIIGDIAHRLGISDFIIEGNPSVDIESDRLAVQAFGEDFFKKMRKQTEEYVASQGLSAAQTSAVLKDFDKIKPLSVLSMVTLAFARFQDVNKATEKEGEIYQHDIRPVYASMGYRIHHGEKDRYDAQGNKKSRFDKTLEPEMVDSILSCNEHSVSVYGIFHLPIIVDLLKKTDREVLAFDIDNRSMRTDIPEEFTRRRMLMENKDIQPVVIDGEPPNYVDAARMMLTASFRHRARAGEISGDMAEEFITSGLPMYNLLVETALANIQTERSK